jgi:ribonuclease P protein component
LKEERYLTAKKQYDLVYDKGATWSSKTLVLKAVPNGLEMSRYGFTISRRVGKAVVRNRIKRRLREIIRQKPVRTGWDMVFIARVPAAGEGFAELDKSVGNLLRRSGLLAERRYEKNRSGVN